ncbi:MAG: DUF4124 domain-containing protein [Deltaproteobacteria bacterium]|nr:DUF4124 domain-containing protein [Deltaproteobacteria bacterium]
MNSKLLLIAALLSSAALHSLAAAESVVYKSTDKDGNVVYSSKPPAKGAKPADLPPIMRGEVKLVEQKLTTCDKHGGVNCPAGPDSDGSVICLDGFKEASARFRFTCNSPKLEISDISEIAPDGTFTVFVRNTKSIAAQKPLITYKSSDEKDVKIKGPESIDAFGVAEFHSTLAEKDRLALKRLTMADLSLTCSNCP